MMEAPAILSEKLGTFTDRFYPRTAATYNNNESWWLIIFALMDSDGDGTVSFQEFQ